MVTGCSGRLFPGAALARPGAAVPLVACLRRQPGSCGSAGSLSWAWSRALRRCPTDPGPSDAAAGGASACARLIVIAPVCPLQSEARCALAVQVGVTGRPLAGTAPGCSGMFRRRAPFELASVAVQASEVPEMAVWGRSIGVPATGRSAFGSISTGAAPVVRTWQGPCSLLVSPLLQGSLTHDEVPNDERKRGRGCEPPGSG